MKIKLMMVAVLGVCCMIANATISYELAQKGALAKVRIKVVDQDGLVVSGAKIRGGFTNEKKYGGFVVVDGETDQYGMLTAEGLCNELLRFDVMKEGYYHSEIKINFWKSKVEPIVIDGKWQPYGVVKTVVIKKIKNLGKLCVPDGDAWNIKMKKIPQYDQWLAFDLEKFDWAAPYGNGRHQDVFLRFKKRETSLYYDVTCNMEVCFTNNPFAGAYIMEKEAISDFKTVYEADTNAVFKSTFSFVCEQTADRKKIVDYLTKDQYLVFRTRTTVDEEGRLKSAHYGVIQGAWMSGVKFLNLYDGCFNPLENDCSIEDGYYLRNMVKHYKRNQKNGVK